MVVQKKPVNERRRRAFSAWSFVALTSMGAPIFSPVDWKIKLIGWAVYILVFGGIALIIWRATRLKDRESDQA